MNISSLKTLGRSCGITAAAFASLLAPAHAGSTSTTTETSEISTESWLSQWWHGKYATGNWGGFRDTLEDNGLKLSGKYYGALFGVVDSEKGSRGFWDQGIEFGGELNFGKLLKVDEIKGVKGFANFRWRDSRKSADPNQFVEGSSMFNPTNWMSGTQFRVLSFGLEIGTDKLLPVKDMIVFRGGWLQPQKEFIDQPLSKLFLNNAVNSAKGVGGNIPFSSSFSTWGGTLQVKPVEWHYVKAGLFMAYPSATSSDNHGAAFEGFAQDPSQNGLMVMAETGVTPKIGPSELPGKYAVGGYYYGGEAESFNGTYNYGQFGFYWQADQMLFREPSDELPAPTGKSKDSKAVVDGKSFKAEVPMDKIALNDQGLSTFNLIYFAPKYNNLYSFYFQSGLVYKGLIPHRDDDLTMFSIAFGNYSYYNIEQLQQEGNVNQPNYTVFLEGGYRVAINEWAFIQPFIQYSIKPAGHSNVQNATIIGFYTGLTF